MRDPENMIAVAALRPDYMGFFLPAKQKGSVPADFKIPKDFPSGIKRVGVFVNESTSTMLRLVGKFSLDYVQLHGEESPLQCEELRTAGVGVIKVFALSGGFDFKALEPFKKAVDYFLFDNKGTDYGGTGMAFDWERLNEYDK